MSSAVDLENEERRVPLNRARVLQAAVDLADRDGIDAVSMRRLGQDLGIEAMSLYTHVRGKEDLLDGMVDAVSARSRSTSRVPTGGRPCDGTSSPPASVMLRHRWAARIIETRTTPGPANLRYMEAVTGILLDGGFTVDLAHHAMHVLGSRVLGFSQDLYDDSGVPDPERGRLGGPARQRLPEHRRARDGGQPRGWHRWLRRRLRVRVRARPHPRWARAAARHLSESALSRAMRAEQDTRVHLPTGDRVTFLFSDIEGSTRLAQRLDGDRWVTLLREHDALVDGAVSTAGGQVVKHEGDGTFAVFADPADALAAAAAISRAMTTLSIGRRRDGAGADRRSTRASAGRPTTAATTSASTSTTRPGSRRPRTAGRSPSRRPPATASAAAVPDGLSLDVHGPATPQGLRGSAADPPARHPGCRRRRSAVADDRRADQPADAADELRRPRR